MKKRRDPDLAALLAAAAAPDPERDGGERGLDAILAAYREAADAPAAPTSAAGRTGNRIASGPSRFTLAVAVKCAAALIVVAGAGMAAASVGVLPTPMQQFAHDYFGGVGIPAPPTAAPTATATSRVSASRSAVPHPTPVPTGSASHATAQATANELVALCEIVVRAGDDWHSDLDKAQRDLLNTAAGGNAQVAPYCDALVANSSSSAAPPPPSGQPSPDPGDGNGNGNGNGNGGNGNGAGKGHASKSPEPHSTKN